MLIVLSLLNVVEKRYMQAVETRIILVEVDHQPGVVKTIRKAVEEITDQMHSFTIQRHPVNKRLRLRMVVRVSRDKPIVEMLELISGIEGVRKLKIT